jgi:hypothetical protein
VKYCIFALLLACLTAVSARFVFAQAPAQVAVNTQVFDTNAQAGDILSISSEGLVRSTIEYDSQIVGVLVEAPVISVAPRDENTDPVASSGSVSVRVSSANGTIGVGDFITSSSESGVGMKATESGYVLGKALTALDGDAGQITVAVEIGYRKLGDLTGAGGLLQGIFADGER